MYEITTSYTLSLHNVIYQLIKLEKQSGWRYDEKRGGEEDNIKALLSRNMIQI